MPARLLVPLPYNPELEVIDEEDEDPVPEAPPLSTRDTIKLAEDLQLTLMRRPNFTSTDSLYFATLIDSLRKDQRASAKQTTMGKFYRRLG